MPPLEQRRGAVDCFPPFNTSAAIIDRNLTSAAETNTHEDMQALMYIVCVLLFYSLGIVVGIITYLKREKQEIEESKMFDEFVTIINERQPNSNRLIKVQEVIQRLEQLQRSKDTLPQPECAEIIYPGKNTYTSVLSPSTPLGLSSNTYGVYETLNNEPLSMDIAPKADMPDGRREDGYVSDSDPFQNKRLSQVVAQILDSNPDIGPEDVFDDVDGEFYDEDSLCTDFINYKEEPKNKELFRTLCKGTEEWDSEGTGVHKTDISGKDSEWPQPPKLRESVNEKSALLESEDSSTSSPTTTVLGSRENVEKDANSDAGSSGFRWSVTSV